MKKNERNELKGFVKHILQQAGTDNKIELYKVNGKWIMTIIHDYPAYINKDRADSSVELPF